ncbi:PBP1A family penicillin-binding protein [Alphaproteobacteria bacterium]|nr:PBP1A family penicillin-binding protein [Alphaproteobacteria bacterium]
MKYFFIYLKKIIIISLFLGFFSFSIVLFFLWKYSPELPSYDELKNYNPNLSSRVFTSDGVLLDKYFIEERIFVPIDRIPNNLINAFISAEDKNFFSHKGIDPFAIIRAIYTNLLNKISNKRMIGASTISQQVVKNLLLTNEISFERKFKEMILAIRIENILSKQDILELYLNDIYLGYGSYGVASASMNYFNKALNELSIDECAFLAALPKAPNNYNPNANYKKAIERRNWVLRKMQLNKFINLKKMKLLSKEPLKTSKRYEESFEEADYYKAEVRKQLKNTLGNKLLFEEGLVVKTSIDTNLQKILDQVLIDSLINQDKKYGWRGSISKNNKTDTHDNFATNIKNPFPKKWSKFKIININKDFLTVVDEIKKTYIINLNNKENKWLLREKFLYNDVFFAEFVNSSLIIRQVPKVNGGIVAIDPHTGKVLALTGGFSFKLSEFNRATQAYRQPGSAFKPFVYISALKEGYSPSTLVLDAPYVVDQGPGLPKWKPSNYTDKFYGLSTMRTGIEKSRNLMTIRLSDKIGMKKILNTAEDFKIADYMDENLSMSLGAGSVNLIDLTNAYAMIVNGGKEINPTLILSVNDKNGKQIINNEINKCINCLQNNKKLDYKLPVITSSQKNILDSRIAFQITSMLEGVVLRGTGKKISSLDIPLAGKTGTTNDNKDAWFIGFSPDLALGVFIGFDKPKTLGFKQTGSAVAVPIFKKFMKDANINSNKIPFRIPSGLSFVKIDQKTGLMTKDLDGILEPFIVGTEPYNNNIIKLDSLSSINNNSISGTGSLLIK